MLKMRLATGEELRIEWAGVSSIDGSLRFEVVGETMARLVQLFMDAEKTATLTRVFDEDERAFEGYTTFKGVDLLFTGNIIVAMLKG